MDRSLVLDEREILLNRSVNYRLKLHLQLTSKLNFDISTLRSSIMAPPAADNDIQPALQEVNVQVKTLPTSQGSASRLSGPLSYSGSLDSYEQFDVTAVIGREFPGLQLTDILHNDRKIRDLAVLGKTRSMVAPL